MNAISRPPTQEDMDAAAAIYIPREELDKRWREAQARRAREERRQRWTKAGRLSLVLALAAVCVAEGIALASLAPLVRVEPHFVWMPAEGGPPVTSVSWNEAPSDARVWGIRNVLTDYVACREGWSSGQSGFCWDMVSALSTKDVRKQFQSDYHKDNPQSPVRMYGDKASLNVHVTDIQRENDRPDAYRVYFKRTLRNADGDGRPEDMVATLRIRDILQPKEIPWWQRIRFNGPAIAVWEYPGARHAVPNNTPTGAIPR